MNINGSSAVFIIKDIVATHPRAKDVVVARLAVELRVVFIDGGRVEGFGALLALDTLLVEGGPVNQ